MNKLLFCFVMTNLSMQAIDFSGLAMRLAPLNNRAFYPAQHIPSNVKILKNSYQEFVKKLHNKHQTVAQFIELQHYLKEAKIQNYIKSTIEPIAESIGDKEYVSFEKKIFEYAVTSKYLKMILPKKAIINKAQEKLLRKVLKDAGIAGKVEIKMDLGPSIWVVRPGYYILDLGSHFFDNYDIDQQQGILYHEIAHITCNHYITHEMLQKITFLLELEGSLEVKEQIAMDMHHLCEYQADQWPIKENIRARQIASACRREWFVDKKEGFKPSPTHPSIVSRYFSVSLIEKLFKAERAKKVLS